MRDTQLESTQPLMKKMVEAETRDSRFRSAVAAGIGAPTVIARMLNRLFPSRVPIVY
jgi:hypothetical protein